MRVKVLLALVWGCLCTADAVAQVPTGTISGRVTDTDGGAIPGVTVTATSSNLQGARTVVTSAFGDYTLPLLPPGDYMLAFELSGFQTVTRNVSIAPTQMLPVDVTLSIAAVTETVTVVADATPFVQTAQVATNFKQELMETLPTNRTLQAAVLMAPNAKATGPGGTTGGDGSFTLSGAMAYDSLFLLNGVAITENLRGQPFNLFIEDAIQETTIATAGISAEYGRFGGGMVNAITKSGGNRFSGSFRTTLNNDSWRATTPFNEPKADITVPTYEYTGGGPVFRDRLWFFTAGRLQEQDETRQTFVTNVPYQRVDDQQRYEGKLTYSPTAGQTVRGSYTRINQVIRNTNFQNVMDVRSLYDQGQPQNLLSLNYNGIIGSALTLEGQYSTRDFTFTGAGSRSTDLIDGTLLIDRSRGGTAFRYWSATFCGVCEDEQRNNTEVLAKASYFLSTQGWGAHNIVAGYDRYNDHRFANNHQSGSDYRILGTSSIVRGETIYPVFLGGNDSTIIQWNPISLSSAGTDLVTNSVFVNDSWRFSDAVTLNLGLRWDKNEGEDAAGVTVSDASKFSPRLGVVWDPLRDGRWAVSASFARYVSALNTSVAENSPAGNPATYTWFYGGPSINADPAAALVTPDVAIRRLFDWFNANGGTGRPFATAEVPGVNTFINGSLDSPNSVESAAGVSRTLGSRGSLRFDYVFRDYNDFYVTKTDLSTGRVTNELGTVFDVSLIDNSNDIERRYQGGTIGATYRVGSPVQLGGNYTLSRTWGNFDGENPASGPLTAQIFSFPEYRQARWNLPEGNLGVDQRHRARVWATYLVPMPPRAGAIDIGVLYSTASGIPYSSGGSTSTNPGTGIGQINPRPYVTNPGYANPLGNTSTVEYFFFERDRFRTETQHRTDLSVNYRYRVPADVDVFFRGEVLNVFNQFQLCGCGASVFNNGGGSDIRTINTSVLTASTSPALRPFNPFTETPQEGVHWALGPTFGRPVSRFAYTSPRTFRFSVGVRF